VVRLNRNQLTKKQLDALVAQLSDKLANLSNSQTETFLTGLLGKEEKTMLAKRLAIIVLLVERKSLYFISENLKVSASTAENIKSKLDRGEYDQFLNLLSKNKVDYWSILEAIDSVLHLGGVLPHYNGIVRIKR
jgi:uncharacterized protein YerC